MRIIKTRTERGRPGTEAKFKECRSVTFAGLEIRNVTRVHVRHAQALAVPSRSGGSRTALEVWRTERGPQVVEEESVEFSNKEVRDKRAAPSGLGDLEVTEYIACIFRGPFEREDGASVHLATTEARFMPN